MIIKDPLKFVKEILTGRKDAEVETHPRAKTVADIVVCINGDPAALHLLRHSRAKSGLHDTRLNMSPGDFKSFLLRGASKDVEDLRLMGDEHFMWTSSVSSRSVRRLAQVCPRVRYLEMESFNFSPSEKDRRSKLSNFPPSLSLLSLRGSVIHVSTFFESSKLSDRQKYNIKVLDLGRCYFVSESGERHPRWPRFPFLQALFLEGCPFVDTPLSLHDILLKSPHLRVLDLEGTDIHDQDVLVVSRCCPELEELYLGYTDLHDSAMLCLERASFNRLSVLCLVGSRISDLGFLALVKCVPTLTYVRVDRSRVTLPAIKAARRMLPVATVDWYGATSVYSVFRHQGCEHYRRSCLDVTF